MHITGLLTYELWINARNRYNNMPEDRTLILLVWVSVCRDQLDHVTPADSKNSSNKT